MNVLLATDGSECSDEAARFLTRFKFSPKDRVTVLHVISEIPYDDDYYAQIKRAIKRVAPKILSSCSDILKSCKAQIETVEEEGYPDTAIIEHAVNSDADLIVMGARGVKGVKLLFLGSSTRAVAINSPKPVLVIKHAPGRTSKTLKVLFATDGSEAAAATARLLASIPFPDDTEMAVMHVVWSAMADIPEKFLMEINEKIKEETAALRAKEFGEAEKVIDLTRTYMKNRFTKMHILTRVGDPSQEILAAEKLIEPDIVAVGCRGVRGIRGMMGSVSRRILGHSEASVLIGKACPGT